MKLILKINGTTYPQLESFQEIQKMTENEIKKHGWEAQDWVKMTNSIIEETTGKKFHISWNLVIWYGTEEKWNKRTKKARDFSYKNLRDKDYPQIIKDIWK